jgi:hypothetical protein
MDLEAVTQSLEDRLGKLTARVSKIESDLRKPGSRDWQDRATEKQNEEVLEQLGTQLVAVSVSISESTNLANPGSSMLRPSSSYHTRHHPREFPFCARPSVGYSR